MTRTGPFCCFAQGLGLVAIDSAVEATFEDGPGFEHPLGRNHVALEAAMARGQAVMLSFGQGQVDYLVQVFLEPAPDTPPENFAVAVGYTLVVDSGEIVIRDTFNLLSWDGQAAEAIRAVVPPGCYFVEMLRIDDPNGLCILHLHLNPSQPPSDAPEDALSGWVDVF